MPDRLYDGDPTVRVIGSHQLTLEMAEDIVAGEFVLFLDAAAGEPARKIKTATVNPTPGPASFAHQPRPRAAPGGRNELYGRARPARLLTILGGALVSLSRSWGDGRLARQFKPKGF